MSPVVAIVSWLRVIPGCFGFCRQQQLWVMRGSYFCNLLVIGWRELCFVLAYACLWSVVMEVVFGCVVGCLCSFRLGQRAFLWKPQAVWYSISQHFVDGGKGGGGSQCQFTLTPLRLHLAHLPLHS